jgi:hypothetical protein
LARELEKKAGIVLVIRLKAGLYEMSLRNICVYLLKIKTEFKSFYKLL